MRSSKLTMLFAIVLICSAAALVNAQGIESNPTQELPGVATPTDEASLPTVEATDGSSLPETEVDESKMEVDWADCVVWCFEQKAICMQECYDEWSWCGQCIELWDCRADCNMEFDSCRKDCNS